MNVNSDPGRAVGVEMPMMGLLVSGLVCARLEQRKAEEFSKTAMLSQGLGLFVND